MRLTNICYICDEKIRHASTKEDILACEELLSKLEAIVKDL